MNVIDMLRAEVDRAWAAFEKSESVADLFEWILASRVLVNEQASRRAAEAARR